VVIQLTPRNKKLAFDKIVLVVAPDAAILRVRVLSDGGTSMEYALEGEQRNLKLAAALFQFKAPAGARVVEVGGGVGQ
jgi:outer membrane lipoprotein-sorting protein